MKRYILYILIFFCISAFLDRVIGKGLDYMAKSINGGENSLSFYILKECKSDIIILGSSRAIHHYDSRIIADSLGMSCYNCGNDGNGILNMYGRYKLISSRQKPQIVIYDVFPDNEYFSNNSNLKDLSGLKPYADNKHIKELFSQYDKKELVKLNSYLYRYNTSFFQLLKDFVKPVGYGKELMGFQPMTGTINYEPPVFSDYKGKLDTLKIHYLKRLIEDCQNSGTKLVFSVSPRYMADTDSSFNYIKKVCQQFEIPFISFYTDKEFRRDKTLFRDSQHLNEQGAKTFTIKMIKELKQFI